jgi:hypothetical protein
MSNNVKAKKKREGGTQNTTGSGLSAIVVAALGAMSVAAAAVFGNWDKIFPAKPPAVSSISALPTPTAIATSPPSIQPTVPPLTPNPPVTPTPLSTPTQLPSIPSQPSPSTSVKLTVTPNRTEVIIEIVQPSDGEAIERDVEVSGTLSGLADGDAIWVYVLPSGENRYYPLKASYDPRSTQWRVPAVVGTVAKEASGATFQIGVFTANSRHTATLLSAGEKGLSQLPSGVTILKSVTVRRK